MKIKNNHAQRISFIHHKGGTGKTTACLNIAGWLTRMHKKVLVVDLDPQANATTGLGVSLKSIENSISEVLLNQIVLDQIILQTEPGIYLAPATPDLLVAKIPCITQLHNCLGDIDQFFDFILIDSPPGSNLLMMNAIASAKNVIIPLDTGVFGFETLETLKILIQDLERQLQISINVMMALLKVFSSSLLHHNFTNEIRTMIKGFFNDNGLQNCTITNIPFSKKICEAQLRGLPISHYAPYSNVSRTYHRISKTILNPQGEKEHD